MTHKITTGPFAGVRSGDMVTVETCVTGEACVAVNRVIVRRHGDVKFDSAYGIDDCRITSVKTHKKPLAVGDRVRCVSSMYSVHKTVLAIADDVAWVRDDTDAYHTFYIKELERADD